MSVHRMPPRDEPFDPRLAALAHAEMAGELVGMGNVSVEVGRQNATQERILAELTNAVACGLVYVGDRVDDAARERPVALQLVLPNREAVAAWRALDEQETPPEPTPTDSWREFLREQAAQIPEGIEFALRELVATLSRDSDGWKLDGVRVPAAVAMPITQLADWLNQLGNVRREVADGRAGE